MVVEGGGLIETEDVENTAIIKIGKAEISHADPRDPMEFVEISCHACFPAVVLTFRRIREEIVMICLVFAAQNGRLHFRLQV